MFIKFFQNEWAKGLGIGGGMMWSVDQDDTEGSCKHGKRPITKAVSDVWGTCNGKAPTGTSEESEETQEESSQGEPTAPGSGSQAGKPCTFGQDIWSSDL